MAYVPRASQTGQGAAQVIRTPRADLSGLKERIAEINKKELEAIQSQKEAMSLQKRAELSSGQFLPAIQEDFKKDIDELNKEFIAGNLTTADLETSVDDLLGNYSEFNKSVLENMRSAPTINEEEFVLTEDGKIKKPFYDFQDKVYNRDNWKGDEKFTDWYQNEFFQRRLPRPSKSYSELIVEKTADALRQFASTDETIKLDEGQMSDPTYITKIVKQIDPTKLKVLNEALSEDEDIAYAYMVEKDPSALNKSIQYSETPEEVASAIQGDVSSLLTPIISQQEKRTPQGRGGGSGTGQLVEGQDYIIESRKTPPTEGRKKTWGSEEYTALTPKEDLTIMVDDVAKQGEGSKAKNVPIKVETKLQEVYKKGDNFYAKVLEDKGSGTFVEKALKLNKNQLSNLKLKGYDVVDIFNKYENNKREIEDDAIYYLAPDGSKVSIEMIESAYKGNVPPEFEKVTEENQEVMEANRSDRAKQEEAGESGINWE